MSAARRRLRSASPLAAVRSLYSRWRGLSRPAPAGLEPLTDDTPERALERGGAAGPVAAERGLHAASKSRAEAVVEIAEEDPQLDPAEIARLREELRRELDRLAGAETP